MVAPTRRLSGARRVIPHYLYCALQARAGVSAAEAKAAVAGMNIIQVYGSLGPLEWQDSKEGIPFGSRTRDLNGLAERIFTYTEQRQKTDVPTRIDDALETAVLIIFLGFGYHEQNLSLLKRRSGGARQGLVKVIGTVFGMDEENMQSLRNALSDLGIRAEGVLLPRKCGDLLASLAPMIRFTVG